MGEREYLAERFEENRSHLRSVAYRMLGSLSEADDAVQEAWLRFNRSDAGAVENLGGWLTTVVARVCLDMLRSRKARAEESLDARQTEPAEPRARHMDPEEEAQLADSVGLALLVVLERLSPAERLAFVLHETFAVPFDEIASILGRSPAATRQLASRARRRVRGGPAPAAEDLARQREVVDAYLDALRAGDVEALLAVLDPDFVIRADAAAAHGGEAREVHGARVWAKQAIAASRGARLARVALIDGAIGVVVAPRGKLFRALTFRERDGKITDVDVIGDLEHLKRLRIAALDG